MSLDIDALLATEAKRQKEERREHLRVMAGEFRAEALFDNTMKRSDLLELGQSLTDALFPEVRHVIS